jgi:hypothetical protein
LNSSPAFVRLKIYGNSKMQVENLPGRPADWKHMDSTNPFLQTSTSDASEKEKGGQDKSTKSTSLADSGIDANTLGLSASPTEIKALNFESQEFGDFFSE